MIQIKNRFTFEVIFESKKESIREALLEAVRSGANLHRANLRGVDLCGVNLHRADLRGADLRGANLRGADLCYANLSGANLRGVDLYYADLRGADLRGANLRGAKNIHSFQCGSYNRVSFAVKHEAEVKFQIGCFWGNAKDAIKLIKEKYGEDSYYEKLVIIYNDMLKDN